LKKKGFQLWSDLPNFEAEKSFKQRLVFSEKNGLQLSLDFLQCQVKKSLKQRWDFSPKYHWKNGWIFQIKKLQL